LTRPCTQGPADQPYLVESLCSSCRCVHKVTLMINSALHEMNTDKLPTSIEIDPSIVGVSLSEVRGGQACNALRTPVTAAFTATFLRHCIILHQKVKWIRMPARNGKETHKKKNVISQMTSPALTASHMKIRLITIEG
jgi:hypothetical protein